MPAAASSEVAAAVADAHRREWAFVLAATLRVAGDIDKAEEAVQDAYASALATWGPRGIPKNPGAWLTVTARRRALDMHRRAATEQRALPRLCEPEESLADEQALATEDIPDDRLRLIFTCCHPALAPDARVALTLRLLCGLSTADIARAFLVPEATIAARITRAKKKIAAAGIPYSVPAASELHERIDGVLSVVYLVYTTGHTAPSGADLMRRDLAERGLELAGMLRVLLPNNRDVAGLLALVLLTDARRDARLDRNRELVLLEDQDRSAWDRAAIGEGVALLREALSSRPPGRFALTAAIAAVHDESGSWSETDWQEILGLYDLLMETWPSPVVQLNRAIALGFAVGPAEGLAELDALGAEPQLARYPYLAAARADFLARLGRTGEARDAFEEALILTDNDAERSYLRARLASRLAG
ncbi:RNA polymerase sigma factor (sigma-70 family) [Pseudarthrobacter siccitolerans]|uniref:RNA polymerase sigma factor (Sigma-70 family) n=1 Tax=Pseudarthrobacter siccitolerans TaxID=861266 RepID=A0ABU0PJ03_9MICC|nr:sigma-70 family RNA polymerase sigma factor [Pseudarthrobacter siccitolerans]MDQ0673938.1 RNA polymerase sigma factor (sigma-70 family) [Pseudarthrobacter siccitolerans]